MSRINNHIDYVEFKANDLVTVKQFYQSVFGWAFMDYGPTYTAFTASGLEGGFEWTDQAISNGALIILYHDDLALVKAKVVAAKGQISKDIFSFPGGKRFHFIDPAGNELAVWSEA